MDNELLSPHTPSEVIERCNKLKLHFTSEFAIIVRDCLGFVMEHPFDKIEAHRT